MQRSVLAATVVLGVSGLGAAMFLGLPSDPAEGQPSTVSSGRLERALDEVRRGAEGGDAAAQYLYGQRYERGEEVIQDYVAAHMWYNLAATHGHKEAAQARTRLAERMTAAQLARAQDLARDRLAGKRAAAAGTVPPGSITAADIEAVQGRLNQLGYKAGHVDGRLGTQTRNALRAWQGDSGLKPTGEVTAEVVARLQPPQAPQLASADGGATAAASAPVDADAIRQVQQRLNALGFQAGTPDGRMGSRTRSAVRAYQQAAGLLATGEIDPALLASLQRHVAGKGGEPAAEPPGFRPSEDHLAEAGRLAASVQETQRELTQHGYWRGPQSGELSPALRQAIKEYQADAGLTATGQVSEQLLDHLRYARPEVMRQQARAR